MAELGRASLVILLITFAPEAGGNAQELLSLEQDLGVRQVAFSPNSQFLAVLPSGFRDLPRVPGKPNREWPVQVYPVAGGKEPTVLRHFRRANCCAFSPDGKRLATAIQMRSPPLPGTPPQPFYAILGIWDIARGEVERNIEVDSQVISTITFSPDGKFLVSGGSDSNDGTCQLWDLGTGKEVAKSKCKKALGECLSFAPNGRRIAAMDNDGDVWIWEAEGLRLEKQLSWQEKQRGVLPVLGWTPDSKSLLAVGFRGDIIKWDVSTGKSKSWNVIEKIARGPSFVHSGVLLPGDPHLLILMIDNDIYAADFNLQSFRKLEMRAGRGGRTSMTLSADCRRLAIGWHTTVRVWDVAKLLDQK